MNENIYTLNVNTHDSSLAAVHVIKVPRNFVFVYKVFTPKLYVHCSKLIEVNMIRT